MGNDQFAAALDLARQAKRVEFFTGAGMSAESGLDTFRDAQTGLWTKVDPVAFASVDSWARDPEPMWAWYLWRGTVCRNASANAGHRAIADWAGLDDVSVGVVTQNIDDLHERGGAEDVVHLHGSLFEYRCADCDAPWDELPDFPVEPVARMTPPECATCSGMVRPGVVWFGENLPPLAWQEAEERMTAADLVVVVGTSGVVYPAAGLPVLAKRSGARILEISPERTDLSDIADVSWRTTAAQGLPQLVMGLTLGGL